MKLVRYGAKGAEKPGLIDEAGQLRDLSGEVDGFPPAPDDLRAARAAVAARCCDAAGGRGRSAARPAARAHRPLHRDRPELCRPRGGIGHAGPGRAGALLQGAELDLRPERRRDHPEGLAETRLGGGARLRDRHAAPPM